MPAGWFDHLRRTLGWSSTPAAAPVGWVDNLRRAMGWYSVYKDTDDTTDCPTCNPCIQFQTAMESQADFDRWFDVQSGSVTVTSPGVAEIAPGTIAICRSEVEPANHMVSMGLGGPIGSRITAYLDYVDTNNYHEVERYVLGQGTTIWYRKVEAGATVWEVDKFFPIEQTSQLGAFCFTSNYIAIDFGVDSSPVTTPHNGTFVGFGAPASNTANTTASALTIEVPPDPRRHYQCRACQQACEQCLDGQAPIAYIVEIPPGLPESGTHRFEMSERPHENHCLYKSGAPHNMELNIYFRFAPPIGWTGPVTWSFELTTAFGAESIAVDDGGFTDGSVPCLTVSNLPLNKTLFNDGQTLSLIDNSFGITISASLT